MVKFLMGNSPEKVFEYRFSQFHYPYYSTLLGRKK